ncbi:MAG: Trm112 family protein [Candidatus Zixiibacteriota bacterium]
MTLDDKLLKVLVCPKCKGKLDYDHKNENLQCSSCRLKFKIDDNIPVLLIDEAESY